MTARVIQGLHSGATLRVLSMGWGKQTWAMAAMMALGDMPKADFLVFADTGHEQQATYEFVEHWTPWLVTHGLSVVTVHGQRTDVLEEAGTSVLIPAFTVNATTRKKGQLQRQCTGHWKIKPIRAWVRDELARRGAAKRAGAVEMWMGISLEESLRMRTSDVAYIIYIYPLVERRLTRTACITYLETHGLPVPPKSACTFCPFTSLEAWRQRKRARSLDWQEAVASDTLLRNKRPLHGPLFLHPTRLPLAQAVRLPEDSNSYQMTLPVDESCESGYCFV